ncbi:hypothetical protein NP493_1125g00066 [Ridgeia piscesae]|uniref:Uncharacterized protein n=2 Tax=Ridgeia piscesae TaxID=27915 RepID=A0AAD9KGR8_RIDPI|nr:hypothetical protein NP493_1125g00066 [Ridgeia piscesae]
MLISCSASQGLSQYNLRVRRCCFSGKRRYYLEKSD